MERTTIYLEEKLKGILLELSYKESKKKRKRIGMAEIIRMAIINYLEQKEIFYQKRDVLRQKMLSVRGALGKKYAKRVQKVQKELRNTWKIES